MDYCIRVVDTGWGIRCGMGPIPGRTGSVFEPISGSGGIGRVNLKCVVNGPVRWH